MSASELPTRHRGEETTVRRGGTLTTGPDGEAGLLMDRYRLHRRLGSGAFGTVWAARDERLERDVAIKILPREHVIHARFQREARAAARLQHPAIVTLYEASIDDDGAYLVSELVRGRTLDALLERGRLSDREILEVGVSLCDALAHAHGQGVIHRDLKPSNVLVPSRGRSRLGDSGERAKLTDFGVAHVIGGANLTHTGDVVGTLAYMAPEQAEGREVGPEADLYALALVLYESLCGVNPQAHSGRRSRHGGFIPPLRRQRRDLSRHLAAAIDRALAPRPVDRGSLLELRAALLRSLDEADDTPGVIAPAWRGEDETLVQDEPGPEWRERWLTAPQRQRHSGAAGQRAGSTATALLGTPWRPRAANAVAAGLGAAWLCGRLWPHAPAPPAVAGLAGALLALLLPRVGSLLTAVALGAVGLAAAFPAVLARLGGGWLRRALFGAAGLGVLVGVSRATHHNLYWSPATLPPRPLTALALFGVWAAAAALQPLLRVRWMPALDLLLCAAWSVALVVGTDATRARPLNGELAGVALGALLLAVSPTLRLLAGNGRSSPILDGVA